jgi:hypothetical protein
MKDFFEYRKELTEGVRYRKRIQPKGSSVWGNISASKRGLKFSASAGSKNKTGLGWSFNTRHGFRIALRGTGLHWQQTKRKGKKGKKSKKSSLGFFGKVILSPILIPLKLLKIVAWMPVAIILKLIKLVLVLPITLPYALLRRELRRENFGEIDYRRLLKEEDVSEIEKEPEIIKAGGLEKFLNKNGKSIIDSEFSKLLKQLYDISSMKLQENPLERNSKISVIMRLMDSADVSGDKGKFETALSMLDSFKSEIKSYTSTKELIATVSVPDSLKNVVDLRSIINSGEHEDYLNFVEMFGKSGFSENQWHIEVTDNTTVSLYAVRMLDEKELFDAVEKTETSIRVSMMAIDIDNVMSSGDLDNPQEKIIKMGLEPLFLMLKRNSFETIVDFYKIPKNMRQQVLTDTTLRKQINQINKLIS